MDNRELWLAATLVELADGPDADFGETTYSGRLALRLAQLLAPAEVGVLTGDASALTATAASTERANHLVSFEAGHGEGPGTACYTSGQPVLNESLIVAGGRWPRFAAAARAAGFRIVSSLPIRRHHETVGVITALGTDEQPLGATEISLAQILAEAAAIAVLQQRALHRSTQTAEELQRALDSRVLIEQAKGALAARLGITPEAAFGLLRGFARRHNRLLAEVAGNTISGDLPASELVAATPETSRSRPAGR
jgi:GAF domain-containing protein